MKLEVLLKDKNLEDQIAGIQIPEGISLQIKKQAGLNFAVYEINQDNLLNSARLLSQIKEEIIKKNVACYISADDASEFFNLTLYPDFNKFERNFRKLLYIIALKSNEPEIRKCADLIEETKLNSLMDRIFNREKTIKQIKKRAQKTQFIKQRIEEDIDSLPKKSLWTYFIIQHSYLENHYEEIKGYRNKVMHAGNMSYAQFETIKASIDEANMEIDKLISLYGSQTIYVTTPVQKTFIQIFRKLFIDLQNNS